MNVPSQRASLRAAAGTLGTFDVIGLVLVTVAIMVYAAIAFST